MCQITDKKTDDSQTIAHTLVAFSVILRQLGIRTGTSELLDALEGIRHVDLSDRSLVKYALQCTLVKNADDAAVFSDAFDHYFLPPEEQQLRQEAWANRRRNAEEQLQQAEEELVFRGRPLQVPEELKSIYARMPDSERERMREFLHKTSHGVNMKDRFQSVVEKLVQGSLSYWQRQLSPEDLAELASTRRLLSSEDHSMRVVDAAAGTGGNGRSALLMKNMKDIQDDEIPQVHALIRKLTRRLSTHISRRYQMTAKHKLVDLRHTIRRNMRYGGIMLSLKFRTKKIHKPRIVILCDVSASMTPYVRFTLPFIYSMSQVVKNIHSFIFANDLENVTDYFRQGTIATATDQLLDDSRQMGQGTNLHKALLDLHTDYGKALSPSTLVVIISDAKTMYPKETTELLRQTALQSKSILWLNTEAQERWGESEHIPLFRQYCQMFECYSLAHLAKIIRTQLTVQ